MAGGAALGPPPRSPSGTGGMHPASEMAATASSVVRAVRIRVVMGLSHRSVWSGS